jgi:hypothetical protein
LMIGTWNWRARRNSSVSRYQSPLLLPTRMRGLSSGEFHLVYSVIDSPSMCGWYKQVVLFVPHGIKYYKFVLSLIGIWEASSIKHSCTSYIKSQSIYTYLTPIHAKINTTLI